MASKSSDARGWSLMCGILQNAMHCMHKCTWFCMKESSLVSWGIVSEI